MSKTGIVTLAGGRLVGGRWWDSTLAVAPAIVVVTVELFTGVANTLIGHALFLPTVGIAIFGAVAVTSATVRRLDRFPDSGPPRAGTSGPSTGAT